MTKRRDVEGLKAAAYKTVEIFAAITKRKLWLRDSGRDGPRTNGHEIAVPFADRAMYQHVEHELAHVLFRSDPIAKDKFVADYVALVAAVAAKQGVVLDRPTLADSLQYVVETIEDHRVNGLWGRLYPGSAAILAEQDRAFAAKHATDAKDHLLTFFACVANDVPVEPGPLDRFRPVMLEALRKVERRGFGATLVASKWLVTQLVSEMIREARHEPPMDPASGASGGGSGGSGGQGDPDAPPTQNGAQESPENGVGNPGWFPPPVEASLSDRAVALRRLAEEMRNVPGDLMARAHDVIPTDAKFVKRDDATRANRTATLVHRLNVHDASTVGSFFEESEIEMARLIEEAKEALRSQNREGDWITKGALARVTLVDIGPDDHIPPPPAPPPRSKYEAELRERAAAHREAERRTDDETVRRLRAVFHRVMGKRRSSLDDTGQEIDVPAYVQRLIGNSTDPVFRHEERGRGFRALVLIDRSGSMKGRKGYIAERACRVIERSIDFPFVTARTWGFRATHAGQIELTRFEPGCIALDSFKAEFGGGTPLHAALRVASRELQVGDEVKHIFVLTDGAPEAWRADGRKFATPQLNAFVRTEVLKARAHGIGVTALMLGTEVTPKDLTLMFGSRQNWRIVAESDFGDDLVSLVTGSFVEYLRGA